MTDDLVGRLRAFCEHHGFGDGSSPALAAARIEALEAALTEARKYVGWAFDGEVAAPQALDAIDDIAKAALTPEAPHAD